jgi:hypothetical protein
MNGVQYLVGQGFLFFATASKLALGPIQPLVQRVLEALSLGVKWPEHEAIYSSPSSAKVKNVWSHTFTPPCLYGMVLS